jgi:6-phosphofructokinase 2
VLIGSASPVVTVTLNPALDVSMSIDRLVPDRKLRAEMSRREPGGGGVNVSRVLNRFGVDSPAFVVAGGAVGAELVDRLRGEGVDVIDFPVSENTRESFAITEQSTERQYRISLSGPSVADPEALHRAVVESASGAGVVVVSGSMPPGVSPDDLVSLVAALGVPTIVDTSGAALAAVAHQSATIIKPSQRELADLVGWEPTTTEEIERAVTEVLSWGAVDAVVASRGPSGALLTTRESGARWFRPPPVRPVSTVGAGDSMVAGMAAGMASGQTLEQAVRFGVAAGTAAVLTPGTELCDAVDVERLIDQVE